MKAENKAKIDPVACNGVGYHRQPYEHQCSLRGSDTLLDVPLSAPIDFCFIRHQVSRGRRTYHPRGWAQQTWVELLGVPEDGGGNVVLRTAPIRIDRAVAMLATA